MDDRFIFAVSALGFAVLGTAAKYGIDRSWPSFRVIVPGHGRHRRGGGRRGRR